MPGLILVQIPGLGLVECRGWVYVAKLVKFFINSRNSRGIRYIHGFRPGLGYGSDAPFSIARAGPERGKWGSPAGKPLLHGRGYLLQPVPGAVGLQRRALGKPGADNRLDDGGHAQQAARLASQEVAH
jgi:hypothetical protein